MRWIYRWWIASVVLLALYLIVPQTFYALEGEECCNRAGQGSCPAMVMPCDERYALAGNLVLINLIAASMAAAGTKIAEKIKEAKEK